MTSPKFSLWTALLSAAFLLSACEEGAGELFKKKPKAVDETEMTDTGDVAFVEKDVEAPEIFSETDKALWDGRPSLGGVWVAHENVNSPERVTIRNAANGKQVIGALFRRESAAAGPALQISSDTAEALGIVAGVPVELSVVAMRKKKIPIGTPEEPSTGPVETADAPENVDEELLAPIRTSLDADASTPAPAPSATAATTLIKPLPRPSDVRTAAAASKPAAPAPAAPKPAAGTGRFVQMGFFSVESNAEGTLAKLRAQGISGKIIASSSNGTKFWRVLAGPAANAGAEENLLSRVRAMGFTDAFLVKG